MKIEKDYHGARLDRYLCGFLNLPHSLISRLLRKSEILLNNKRATINMRLSEGDILKLPSSIKLTKKEVKRGEGFISATQLLEFQNNIVYEAEDFFVLNKPSGLATQGGSGLKTSVDEFLYHLNPEFRLVHRIDKETSGCLIIAKNRVAASSIAKEFGEKNIKKVYIAITLGKPPLPQGKIDTPLLRETTKKNHISPISVNVKGKESLTLYKTLEEVGEYVRLELSLETGRMHQIRTHLSSIGCKIVGDGKYGDTSSSLALSIMPKMLLHAFSVEYKETRIISPLPPNFIL